MQMPTTTSKAAERFNLVNAYLIEDSPTLDIILSNTPTLEAVCQRLNRAYRQGVPIVSDTVYDRVFIETLRQQTPMHPYLAAVEPEPVIENLPLVRHERPLLSTQKAYEQGDIERFVRQVYRNADEMGVEKTTLRFRLTAKLDGIAGQDTGQQLVTRGDGLQGQDITHIFNLGVQVDERGMGRGELVCDKQFFYTHLGKGTVHGQEHPRNFVAGLVSADTIKAHHKLALEAGAVRFVPFKDLPDIHVTGETLIAEWESLFDAVISDVPYETDGIVVEVEHRGVREAMGATSHHERAVLAIKRVGDQAASTVEGVRLTTGRTGRIIPTLLIKPVVLSGATVTKATAHTAKNLMALGLGPGAEANFCRSGDVIPKLLDIIRPSETPTKVTHCPSCGTEAVEEGEHLICPNHLSCQAQAESRLRHYFTVISNIDLFGKETVATLVKAGITELPAIYAMTPSDFESLGFGPKQSSNLVEQLERSRTESVTAWRWLAAFGIRHLGRGDSRRLLKVIPLEALGDVTAEQIAAIEGFGPITSPQIARELRAMWPVISGMLALGFNLEFENNANTDANAPLAGRRICFTGSMAQGNRKDMEEAARQKGAEVQSSVTSKTTLLVIGERAGSKLKKAQDINAKAGNEVVKILTEADYLALSDETA